MIRRVLHSTPKKPGKRARHCRVDQMFVNTILVAAWVLARMGERRQEYVYTKTCKGEFMDTPQGQKEHRRRKSYDH